MSAFRDLTELSDEDLVKTYEQAIEAKREAQALENAAGDELTYRGEVAALKAKSDALEAARKARAALAEPAPSADQEPAQ